jgi:hypothetical protein
LNSKVVKDFDEERVEADAALLQGAVAALRDRPVLFR